MVSFWPWKSDDSSPASFEKALSALSSKITKTNTKIDSLRQSSRRFSALWTLYTSFAYLLCAAILILVVGWREWGVIEYLGILGGPVLFRISKYQVQSDSLQEQRETTIEKLKNATKYNTTQQLLEKYGGTPPSKGKSPGGNVQKNNAEQGDLSASRQKRTAFVPPPTANIPGRNGSVSLPGTPQRATPHSQDQNDQHGPFSAAAVVPPWQDPSSRLEPSADFAPNAFSSAPQYARLSGEPKWYDRLMDVLLGEDETLPKNRLALICHHCRLVNGQAPPGVQHLGDVGTWRCAGCSTMNGEENEETKLLKRIKARGASLQHRTQAAEDKAAAIESGASEGSADEDSGAEPQAANSQGSESTESETEKHHSSGKSTGAQKGSSTARRRSSRVKRKAKSSS
ncbi:MAG: hypothetical protein Q9181_004878 [Wetmoreana brouardii]